MYFYSKLKLFYNCPHWVACYSVVRSSRAPETAQTNTELQAEEFTTHLFMYNSMDDAINEPLDGHEAKEQDDGYASFSRNQLIDQIKHLKSQLENQQQDVQPKANNSTKTTTPTSKRKKELDFDRNPKRKIALMISYQGSLHGGLAWQPEITRLSTVEGELFRALLVARLVEGSDSSSVRVSDVDFEDGQGGWQELVDVNKWGYSRAGRTDAGVSGCGQVVSLWVRSRLSSVQEPFGFRPPNNPSRSPEKDSSRVEAEEEEEKEELGYHTILNSILPDSVRVLAWSPVHPDFDARFSCTARHYKYFFCLYESPCAPALNIQAMRAAAARLVGEHDFRNFCRIDPSKQLDNFHRRILSAEINPVDDGQPSSTARIPDEPTHDHPGPVYPDALLPRTNRLFVIDLVGTAFLYNMVRHIVSVLFLVGSGHETPDVIERLLYTDETEPEPASPRGSEAVEPIECKPEYCHASALPLLLYRCVYPEASFRWVHTPIGSARPASAEPFVGWTRARIHAQLAFHLLDAPQRAHPHPPASARVILPLGAASVRASASYVHILHRPRAPHFSVINANWWNKVGARRLAKRQPLL